MQERRFSWSLILNEENNVAFGAHHPSSTAAMSQAGEGGPLATRIGQQVKVWTAISPRLTTYYV